MYFNGKFKGFKVGSLWEADVARSNPLQWANDYRQLLKEKYKVDVESQSAMATVIGEIARGNKPFQVALDELLLPQTNRQLNKELGNINQVGADAAGLVAGTDPKSLRTAFGAQWTNVQQSLGENLVQPMMDYVIKPLTEAMRTVSQFAKDNPDAMAQLGKGLAAVSAVIAGLGAAAVIGAISAFIPGAAWALGAAGLIASVEALKAVDWKAVNAGLESFVNSVVSSSKSAWENLKAGKGFLGKDGAAPIYKEPSVPLLRPQSYTAPLLRNQHTTPITIAFHMDGQEVARQVTNVQLREAEFPTRAAAFDNFAMWTPPDMNAAFG